MKFDVSGILKLEGASMNMHVDIPANDLIEPYEDVEFIEPIVFEGQIVNASRFLKLTGKLKTTYKTSCSRCLNNIENNMCIDIDEKFVNAGIEETLDDYTYSKASVCLDRVLVDNILLGISAKQLCSEECKGLCSKCGKSLNLDTCKCEHDVVDERLKVLQNLLKDNS